MIRRGGIRRLKKKQYLRARLGIVRKVRKTDEEDEEENCPETFWVLFCVCCSKEESLSFQCTRE